MNARWGFFLLVPKLPFGNPLQRNSVSRPPRDSLNTKQSFAEMRTRTEFGYELLERFPGSQTPVWEPAPAKLRFASRATVPTRNRVSRRFVPEQSSGTSCWSDFLVPKLPFGNPL